MLSRRRRNSVVETGSSEEPVKRRSMSLDRFRGARTEMQNSAPTCAGASSHHSPSSSTSSNPDKRLSFTGSFSSRRRGRAPSSLIDTEASTSNTLSTPSQEDHTVFPQPVSQRRSASQTRDSLLTLGRLSIVSTPRPSLSRQPSQVSARQEFSQSNSPWSHKSALKRMSWGWNQTFAGLTPTQLTEVEFQRGRATEVSIPKRASNDSRPSTARSEISTTSAQSDASTIISTTPSINKPFANRKPSVARPPEPSLPSVAEEDSNENALEEVDDMGLGRSITKRFHRMSGNNTDVPERTRPVIGLPTLISTTNADLTEAYEVHPALRDSSSSNGYSNPTSPSSPRSETPGLTDSSSLGSSRSSSGDLPLDGRYENGTTAVTPNHLTQYFAPPSPDMVCDNVIVMGNNNKSDDVFSPAAAPALPTRAPSHSKHEHERLARTRSMRSSISSGYSSRHTSANSKQANAFVKELGQVEEVQEVEESKADDAQVTGQGFRTFTPSVYMLDLADMEATRWIDESGRRSVAA